MAILSATANDSIIDKSTKTIDLMRKDSSGNLIYTGETLICTNILKTNGSRERTGAGMLDVTALMNYSNTLMNNEVTFTSDDYVELEQIYLAAGQTVQIALAWQRNATLTIDKFLWWETKRTYSSDVLADLDLYLFNDDGVMVDFSMEASVNVEIITFTASSDGYYTIKLKPYSDYADTHNVNYAYVVK